jgi:beta-lactamase superfamily II metal-dependent hydrolase
MARSAAICSMTPRSSDVGLLAGAGGYHLAVGAAQLAATMTGVALPAPIALLAIERPAGSYRKTLLDSGQGLSAVIETPNHALVYKPGPSF